MEQDISVTLPVIRKAVFTLEFEKSVDLFNVLEYSFNETVNRCDEFNDDSNDIDVFIKEDRVKDFKEEIVCLFLNMLLYSDYGRCQDLRGFFDFMESLVLDELLTDGKEEIDTYSEDFEMPSSASPLLHFLYYFLNSTSHEQHIEITEIFSEINVLDELGLEIDFETLKVNLTNDQIRILAMVDLQ